ncbi:unnamed protein product, partial [Amoebophrya sp. A120]
HLCRAAEAAAAAVVVAAGGAAQPRTANDQTQAVGTAPGRNESTSGARDEREDTRICRTGVEVPRGPSAPSFFAPDVVVQEDEHQDHGAGNYNIDHNDQADDTTDLFLSAIKELEPIPVIAEVPSGYSCCGVHEDPSRSSDDGAPFEQDEDFSVDRAETAEGQRPWATSSQDIAAPSPLRKNFGYRKKMITTTSKNSYLKKSILCVADADKNGNKRKATRTRRKAERRRRKSNTLSDLRLNLEKHLFLRNSQEERLSCTGSTPPAEKRGTVNATTTSTSRIHALQGVPRRAAGAVGAATSSFSRRSRPQQIGDPRGCSPRRLLLPIPTSSKTACCPSSAAATDERRGTAPPGGRNYSNRTWPAEPVVPKLPLASLNRIGTVLSSAGAGERSSVSSCSFSTRRSNQPRAPLSRLASAPVTPKTTLADEREVANVGLVPHDQE